MQNAIGVALLFDIPRYRILAAMLSNRGGEIPIRPEFASPELFFHLRTSLENLTRRKTLDGRYYLGHTVCRNRLNEKMHVILVCTDFQKLYLISILNLYAHPFHHCVHFLIEYGSSVLRRKNQMVYQYRNIMALMYIFAHATTLRRKRRGIQPWEI